MKKSIKKIIATLLVISNLAVPTVSAFATVNNAQSFASPQNKIIEIVKSVKDPNIREASFKQILNSDSAKLQIQKNPTTINISDHIKIAFKQDGSFSISELETSKSVVSTNSMRLYSNEKTTIDYTNKVTRYGPIGNKLYAISVKGYFTGTIGNTPTGHLVNASYTRGILSVWQVSNWEKGSESDEGSERAYVYGRGNFHFGAEYDGNGLVIQDIYEDVYVACDSNFKIYVSL